MFLGFFLTLLAAPAFYFVFVSPRFDDRLICLVLFRPYRCAVFRPRVFLFPWVLLGPCLGKLPCSVASPFTCWSLSLGVRVYSGKGGALSQPLSTTWPFFSFTPTTPCCLLYVGKLAEANSHCVGLVPSSEMFNSCWVVGRGNFFIMLGWGRDSCLEVG